MRRHELTDSEWERIRPLLGRRSGPRSRRGDRDFVNAVIWRVKTGVQWRDLAERYGSWKTVHNRFHRWARTGRWESIFKALRLDVDDVGLLVNAEGKAVVGDSGYDGDRIRRAARTLGMTPVFHPHPCRKKPPRLNRRLYRIRYRIECFFHDLKRYRAVATRHDKTAASYLAVLHVASMLVWLR